MTTELKLGFGMQGMGPLITPYLEQVCQTFGQVTYVEIGVGFGETLVSIASYLRESLCGEDWRAVGIELPNGYSYSEQEVRNNAQRKQLSINFENGSVNSSSNGDGACVKPPWKLISVYLDNSQDFLADRWQSEIHIALIDGCHGKKCATMDFLLLEPFIVPGGIVLMHDFGKDQVGQSQPHCEDGLDVRGAARDLGLMNDSRPGWEFLDELVGDKPAGSGDMGVFQKI